MKLDVTCMRYLTREDYRVLVAVEMGMRNHELVPVSLITSIAQLRHGGSYKILSTLLKYKLVAHAQQEYDGYRLSYLGYDILALHTLQARGIITSVGGQIGIGKESDIFEAMDTEGNEIVIKIHRLGRTSFRAVRKNRDYLQGKSKASWLYMSRLAAIKEFAFMKALHAHGFPTPTPIDQNRHVVVMSRVSGFPLAQIRSGQLEGAGAIFDTCVAILRRLAEHGLIHCDFNEFNLLIDEKTREITLIDFPQMVSTGHANAAELLERDINCLIKFFAMKMKYIPPDESLFTLEDLSHSEVRLDEEIKASGFEDEEGGGNIMDIELPLRLDNDEEESEEDKNREEKEEVIDTVKEEQLRMEQAENDNNGVVEKKAADGEVGEEQGSSDEDEEEGATLDEKTKTKLRR
jgi:RIO kinase 2